MKILRGFFLITFLSVCVAAQKTVLTGTVYDAYGAVILKSKVTAVNQKGEKFESFTNDNGVYELNLPYNEYKPTGTFKIAKYDMTVEGDGFEKFTIKGFKVVGKYTEKMHLDFALDVLVMINPITVPDTKTDQINK